MFNVQCSILIGWVCDLVFGDPQRLPHPIVWFGKVIAFFEHRLNHGSHRRLKGALVSVSLIVCTFALTWFLRFSIFNSLPLRLPHHLLLPRWNHADSRGASRLPGFGSFVGRG